jgi:hypothetical protein
LPDRAPCGDVIGNGVGDGIGHHNIDADNNLSAGEQAAVVVLDNEAEPPSMSGPKTFFYVYLCLISVTIQSAYAIALNSSS